MRLKVVKDKSSKWRIYDGVLLQLGEERHSERGEKERIWQLRLLGAEKWSFCDRNEMEFLAADWACHELDPMIDTYGAWWATREDARADLRLIKVRAAEIVAGAELKPWWEAKARKAGWTPAKDGKNSNEDEGI